MRLRLSQRNSKLHAAFSLIAVCFLFLASVGVPLDQHWCRGSVISQSLYASAVPCSMMTEPTHSGLSLAKINCCNDTHSLQSAEGLDNDGVRNATKPIDQNMSLAMTAVTLDMNQDPKIVISFRTDSPPRMARDIVVDNHSYRI